MSGETPHAFDVRIKINRVNNLQHTKNCQLLNKILTIQPRGTTSALLTLGSSSRCAPLESNDVRRPQHSGRPITFSVFRF